MGLHFVFRFSFCTSLNTTTAAAYSCVGWFVIYLISLLVWFGPFLPALWGLVAKGVPFILFIVCASLAPEMVVEVKNEPPYMGVGEEEAQPSSLNHFLMVIEHAALWLNPSKQHSNYCFFVCLFLWVSRLSLWELSTLLGVYSFYILLHFANGCYFLKIFSESRRLDLWLVMLVYIYIHVIYNIL